jgi:hypothetical protein
MPRHVMLDLETLGSTPGSVILSIGACAFDATDIVSQFHVHISAASCQRAGLTLDASTVLWWMGQSEMARRAVLDADPKQLDVALMLFDTWLRPPFGDAVHLWAKGPSFDCAVLAAAYRAIHRAPPWDFRNERCVRTILALTGVQTKQFSDPNRVRHDALSDALVQARAVQEAMKRIPQ